MKRVRSSPIPAITYVRQRLAVTASSRFPYCRNTPGGEYQRKFLPIHRLGQTGLCADAAVALSEIGCHHGAHHDSSANILMRCARQPALNPLLMLTTPTPEAHELSMVRSGATPPKLAP